MYSTRVIGAVPSRARLRDMVAESRCDTGEGTLVYTVTFTRNVMNTLAHRARVARTRSLCSKRDHILRRVALGSTNAS